MSLLWKRFGPALCRVGLRHGYRTADHARVPPGRWTLPGRHEAIGLPSECRTGPLVDQAALTAALRAGGPSTCSTRAPRSDCGPGPEFRGARHAAAPTGLSGLLSWAHAAPQVGGRGRSDQRSGEHNAADLLPLSLIHISEPTRRTPI